MELASNSSRITLERYTHVLPGELERARDLLDAFLVDRQEKSQSAGKCGSGVISVLPSRGGSTG